MHRVRAVVIVTLMAMALALPSAAGGDAWEYPELEETGWPTVEQGSTVRAVAPLWGWSSPESWQYPVGQPMLAYLVPFDDSMIVTPVPRLAEVGMLVGVIRPVDSGVEIHGMSYASDVHLVAHIEIPEIAPGTYWLANCDLSCTHQLGGFSSAGIRVIEGSGRPVDVVRDEVAADVERIELARLLSVEGATSPIQPVTSYREAQGPPQLEPTAEQRSTSTAHAAPEVIDQREQALVDLVASDAPADASPQVDADVAQILQIEPEAPLSEPISDVEWPALPVALAVAALLAGATTTRRREPSAIADASDPSDERVLVSI